MDRRDLDEIERFLASVGKANLLAYYGIPPEAAPEAVEEAIKKRRNWAQGQQSNPKYKSEALFLIKNNNLLRRVLVEEGDAYRAHIADSHSSRNLDALTIFIKGTLASGILSPQAEAAIHHQGKQLELSEAVVTQRIDEVLREIGGRREGGAPVDDELGVDARSVDYYDLLGVPDTATIEQIEAAYRARYRWARTLKDLKKSAEVLQHLDDGWRILKDPSRRQKYDALRTKMMEVTDEVEKRAATLLGLLGGPAGVNPGPWPEEERKKSGDPQRAIPAPTAPPIDPAKAGPRASYEGGGGVRPGEALPQTSAQARTSGDPAVPANASMEELLQLAKSDNPRIASAAMEALQKLAIQQAANIQGRTLDLASGPQTVRTRGPRLSVEGAETVNVTVSGKPLRYGLVVKNTGQGRMPGRVSSDQPWLEVQQQKLEPNAPAQTIGIVLHAERLPGGRSTATVTVATDHGERKTVTFQASRQSYVPLAVGAMVLALFLLVGVGAVVVALLPGVQDPPTPETSAAAESGLLLNVDPPADRIVVNDKEVGKGASALVAAPADGGPMRLRIEADGFKTHEELLTLKAGKRVERTLRLELEDPMDWSPPKGAEATKLGADAVLALQARADSLRVCFAGAEKAQASYTAWVTGDGTVRRVEVAGANFPADAALPCIRRVFRATHLPAFDGVYAVVKATIAVEPAVASTGG
ncbi:MAG: DnaJ domain-containing protein [Myxococcota bacterium]